MALPVSFLVGLAVLLVADEIQPALPGSASLGTLLPWLLLLILPGLLARATLAVLRRTLMRGRLPGPGTRIALRLQGSTVPLVYYLVLSEGGLLELADRWAHQSMLARTMLLLLPLLFLEISLRRAEKPLRRLLEDLGLPVGPLSVNTRLAMALLLCSPVLLFSALVDVAFASRELEVFFTGTSLGTTLGALLVVVVLSVAMPLAFRGLMATTNRLPAHLAADLRATASTLGFPPDNVLAMHTGYRMVNAALVGPLPWPRYLVLTDGLMTILDPFALRGVVAHEIGHARGGHPALLMVVFVVVPLLLFQPALIFGVEELDTTAALIATGALFILCWLLLRGIAHRFEFEADVLSAEALGGAEPCIRALRRVGQLSPQSIHRSSLRHPSEQQRIDCLLRWESDPAFRERFRAIGRRLRRSIAAGAGAALVVAGVAFASAWPVDRAVYRFYTGDIPGALAAVAEVGDAARPGLQDWWRAFRAEVEAAATVVPGGGDWQAIRGRLAEEGWRRGLQVLLEEGPAAARPWLGLALAADEPDPVRESLYLYSEAVAAGDGARAEALRRHLLGLELPGELRAALG